MKNDLGEEILTKFDGLIAKTYSYIKDSLVKIKTKRHKKVCHKNKVKLENYRNFLEAISRKKYNLT